MSAGDDDFAFEPVPGLPARLPEGERLLWQGAPRWTALALQAFRLRLVGAYFALVAAWRAASIWADGGTAGEVVAAIAWTTLLAAASLAILAGLACLYARSTVYSLTTRRIVIRSGLALPVTVDIPLALVETASLAGGPAGTAGIAIEIVRPNRIAWLALWPHVRPWRFNHPQPMLRALADAATVAPLLSAALSATAPASSQTTAMAPRPGIAPAPEAAPVPAGAVGAAA